MTTTTPNDELLRQNIDFDKEFNDAETNYYILLFELKDRIVNLQSDLNTIKDPEVKGCAQKLYTELKVKYFEILVKDLTLQHFALTDRLAVEMSSNQGGKKDE